MADPDLGIIKREPIDIYLAGFAKTLPLGFRLKPRRVSLKASTQTQPRYWPVGGWVAGCCVSKAQPVLRVAFGHFYFECGLNPFTPKI